MYNLTDSAKQFHCSSLEKGSTAEVLVNTSDYVYHMEPDSYQPGNIIYTDNHSLKTTDGVTTAIIAGHPTQSGYKDANGENARFQRITGFIGIAAKILIAADYNHCLRRIHRDTGLTTTFSGMCTSPGYQDGTRAKFDYPGGIISDNRNSNQLLVTDAFNNAIRTVAVTDGSVGTFQKSNNIGDPQYLTQNTVGDIFVTTNYAVYRISYAEKTITLIAGSPTTTGYRDGSLLSSLFNYPRELIFIQNNNLLIIADHYNNKLRLLDLDDDKVTTLNLCNGCVSLLWPYSIMLTNDSLYVGLYQMILRFKRKFSV